ncbi:MAG TPA: D-alanyl-D-alanine carboxypeptidase [Puia sp.]|jgi:D-alanyl-D-alanine carboxypeptidase/D-alanyl-D-alanine-endopeptidase (penicillin-binding protein 4)
MNYKLLIALICSLTAAQAVLSQTMGERLGAAIQKLEADSTLRHGTLSLHVEEAATGVVVFDLNGQVGLAPASCQKLFTSVAALDLLGADYRYATRLGYRGKIEAGVLEGDLCLAGSGDPTLGSWRYDSTKEDVVLGRLVQAVKGAGIRRYTGRLIGEEGRWGTESLPRGWIWEDIGNYYGAGAWGLNWHENQYDVRLKSGTAIGDPAEIAGFRNEVQGLQWINELKTGAPGSGDNAYIYLPPYSKMAFLRGTVPLQKEETVISGSIPMPSRQAELLFRDALKKEGIGTEEGVGTREAIGTKEVAGSKGADVMTRDAAAKDAGTKDAAARDATIYIGQSVSPRLDSINYWFLRRSINLYGEALIKTIALEKTGEASTEKGAELVRDFWAQRGIDRSAVHIIDGSGLSPQNRVTTDALVRVLQYARTRPWYPAFYQALPLINKMHMKSGAIGGARSFSGYQVAADGKEYVFSIIVNNYDGSSSEVIKKLFNVLNILKPS